MFRLIRKQVRKLLDKMSGITRIPQDNVPEFIEQYLNRHYPDKLSVKQEMITRQGQRMMELSNRFYFWLVPVTMTNSAEADLLTRVEKELERKHRIYSFFIPDSVFSLV